MCGPSSDYRYYMPRGGATPQVTIEKVEHTRVLLPQMVQLVLLRYLKVRFEIFDDFGVDLPLV
jgi:hypothetical protein